MFKELNEKLQKFLEEAAIVASNHATFEDFYNYCIKNPKLQNGFYPPAGQPTTSSRHLKRLFCSA